MTKKETRGRPRREKRPFVEVNGKQLRYYRKAPADLTEALGIERWVHVFANNATDAQIDEMSQALCEYHDKLIEQTRNILKLLGEARDRRQDDTVVRA